MQVKKWWVLLLKSEITCLLSVLEIPYFYAPVSCNTNEMSYVLFWGMNCFCQAFDFIFSCNFNCTILNEINRSKCTLAAKIRMLVIFFISVCFVYNYLYLVIILVLHYGSDYTDAVFTLKYAECSGVIYYTNSDVTTVFRKKRIRETSHPDEYQTINRNQNEVSLI
ncbi:hypothetical protein T11_5614 [Trichinella zimbabwensis]|uniref:Uncharacterized protein n=1 Tax=Trichinella zimbabwensis TaxID=268475 RepID=A0A0V1HU12_9BILA|nr:hypothetical protein T11_5614 [Trichinella zimbabwensis]